MNSTPCDATTGWPPAGVAIVTRPAPLRSAPAAARTAAPVLPREPATISTRPQSPLCASAARGCDQRPHRLTGQQLQLRPVGLVDQRQRNADVGNHHVAGDVFGRRQHQRHLRRRQGHGHVGLEDRADELAGIGRQPRRQIDRDHRRLGGVDVGDDRLVQAGERPAEPGADDGVDDDVGGGDLRAVQLPRLRVDDLDDRQAEPADDVEVEPGVATDVGERADDVDGHLDTALVQRAGDDEAIAAVVAGAAQHGDCGAPPARRPAIPSPPPPGGRRSPSARSTAGRARRSSGDRRRASAWR